MVSLEKSCILGKDGLRKIRERYPQLVQALLDLDIAEGDADSEGGNGSRRTFHFNVRCI
jgi:hypothetical protein